MKFTTRLFERDENGKFWPAGKYTWDSLKRAVANLEHNVCDGISGIVTADGAYIAAYRGMTQDEAYRVSQVKIFAIRG